MEWVEEQRNVTKDMDSFETKPAQAELFTTPMDLTTFGMPMCPQPDEGMEERTCEGCEDLITTQGLRRVKDNHTKTTDVMKDGLRDIYLRHRHPD